MKLRFAPSITRIVLASIGWLICSGTPSYAIQDSEFGLSPEEVIHESIEDLDNWLSSFNSKMSISDDRLRWVKQHITQLERSLHEAPSEMIQVASTMLDFASYRLIKLPNKSSFMGGEPTYVIRKLGLNSLTSLESDGYGQAITDWLTRGVLAEPSLNDASRRWFALFKVLPQHSSLIESILLRIASSSDDSLRNEVQSALPYRTDPRIDAFLVEQLNAPRIIGTPHPYNLLRLRLQQSPLAQDASHQLIAYIKDLLLDEDWRVASRGIQLSLDLRAKRTIPMLVEALFTWNQREQSNVASARRTAWEISRALRKFSGLSIGTNPRNWMTWWKAVKNDIGETISPPKVDPKNLRSSAGFFGLQPVSNRVTFIIDHSGSMLTRWANSDATRYEQAIDQLLKYLQASGQDTLFNIVLFNSEPITSSPHLIGATPDRLELARKSLLGRLPDGGTNLRAAVEAALKLDRNGDADLGRIEADTIIVLCDGSTDTGPSWIAPLLERVNVDLQVVFHCVQIGSNGDGSLEALARLSGGEFVEIPE
ncbi:MAG: hypothetical protein ACI8TQ_000547 [Planctomycetota bacterium]|jgi:hypothetical protein